MTADAPKTKFTDDAPKTNPWEEDRLGYRPFASRLADTLIDLEAPNGYVVGLHGAWGSGKSTALAFVMAFIRKHNDELPTGSRPLLVVDFRPWMVSGHQDLVSAFFKVLTEALASRRAVRRKRTWRRLLGIGKLGASPVVDAAAALAVAGLPAGAPAITAGAAIAKSSTTAAIDRWLTEPSLQAAYDDLRGMLATDGMRILVLIDDIDRLEKSEIKATMQMMKTVGRLPNVVYLLAYDREIVWSALDDGGAPAAGRPGFAEKIVQHELELPRPSTNALLRLFASEIDFLPIPDEATARRQSMIVHGLRRWIRHPRDVSRLSNALKFAWPALKGEIDPMDLLCMEGLRLFDQQAFSWIRDNRDFLLGQAGIRLVTNEQRADFARAFRDALPGATRDDQTEMLCLLFPNQAATIAGRQRFGDEAWVETVKRRGVASEPGYDAYFSLFPPSGTIRKATVDSAVEALADEARQLGILRQLLDERENAAGLVTDFLVEMQARFLGRHAAKPTAALLHALFAVGEEVQGVRLERGFFSPEPGQQLSALIGTILEVSGCDAAGAMLVEAFQRSTSAAFCAAVYVRCACELGVLSSEGYGRRDSVTRQRLDELGEILLAIIDAGGADGSLARAPFYFDILRSWSHLAGYEAPRAWAARGALESPSFLAKLAAGLLAYSIHPEGRTYILRSPPDASVYDSAALSTACDQHLDTDQLTTDERAKIEALRNGLSATGRQSQDA